MIVFFKICIHQSRWLKLFWLGDQLVTWDDKDVLNSSYWTLTSGLSGFTLNHGDIGGCTTITNPIANYHRSKELMLDGSNFLL